MPKGEDITKLTVNKLATGLRKTALVAVGVLFVQFARAQVKCPDVAKDEADAAKHTMTYLLLGANLKRLATLAENAPNEDERNEQAYSLVIALNGGLDLMVKDIGRYGRGELTKTEQEATGAGIQILLQAVTTITHIPLQDVKESCEKRAIFTEQKSGSIGFHHPLAALESEAPAQRQAIGFAQHELVTNYGRETELVAAPEPAPVSVPMGFQSSKAALENQSDETIVAGFGTRVSGHNPIYSGHIEFQSQDGHFHYVKN